MLKHDLEASPFQANTIPSDPYKGMDPKRAKLTPDLQARSLDGTGVAAHLPQGGEDGRKEEAEEDKASQVVPIHGRSRPRGC